MKTLVSDYFPVGDTFIAPQHESRLPRIHVFNDHAPVNVLVLLADPSETTDDIRVQAVLQHVPDTLTIVLHPQDVAGVAEEVLQALRVQIEQALAKVVAL